MKKLLIALFLSTIAHAQVQQSISQLGQSNNWVLAFRWTANGAGTVPNTAARLEGCCNGYFITQVETVPGSPAPTSGYSVQITDSAGVDALAGAAASLSASSAQSFAAATSAPPIQGNFSLVITGQSVASATGVVYVFLSKPGTVNTAHLGSGSISSSPNWLTISNPPFADPRRYNFPAQSPGGTLAAGSRTIILSPCPYGLRAGFGSLLISGGTGTAEGSAVTAVSCAGGAARGTVTLTIANSHSGAWTVQSASSGIQEALNYLASTAVGFGAGTVWLTPGTFNVYAKIKMPTQVGTRIQGSGSGYQGSRLVRNSVYPAGNIIEAATDGNQLTDVALEDFGITNASGFDNTSGAAIYLNGNFNNWPILRNIYIESGYTGVQVDSSTVDAAAITYLQLNTYDHAALAGFLFTGTTPQGVLRDVNIGSQIASANRLTAGIYIQGSDGIRISDSAAYAKTGMLIEGGHGSNIDDILVSNTLFDASTVRSLDITGTNSPSVFSNIRFNGSHFIQYPGSTAEVIHLRGDADNIQITSSWIAGSPLTGLRIAGGNNWSGSAKSGILISDNLIFDNNQTTTGNEHGVVLETGATGVTLIANRIWNQTPAGHQGYGITTDTTCDNCSIQGNTLYPNTTGAMLLRGAVTHSTVMGNIGVDDVLGTAADAATLAWPINPHSTITGTGTGVTAITSVMPAGFFGTFYTPDGTVAFTASASIGNTCTTTQNQLYNFWWDGTKFWFSGKGC